MDELDRLAGVEPPIDEEELEEAFERAVAGDPLPEWDLPDLQRADYLMARLLDLRARRQRYLDQVALWLRPAEKLERAITWAEAMLKEWGRRTRTKTEKSWELPHGHISTRPVADTLEITDMEKLVEWATDQPGELVHTEQKVLVSELKDRVKVVDRITKLQRVNFDGELLSTLDVSELPEADIVKMIEEEADEHVLVEPIYERVVLDSAGDVIPGVVHKPGYVSVTVKPSAL